MLGLEFIFAPDDFAADGSAGNPAERFRAVLETISLAQRKFVRAGSACPSRFPIMEIPMLDAVLLALGFAFFAASVLYAFACDRI